MTKQAAPNLKLVKTPIKLTRPERGKYIEVIQSILKLKPTTIETGLSPHYEWRFDSAQALKSAYAGMLAARKRHAEFRRAVGISIHNNQRSKDFILYLWHQE